MKKYIVSASSSICRDCQVKIFNKEEMDADYGDDNYDFSFEDNFRDLQSDMIIGNPIMANSKEEAVKIVGNFHSIPDFFLTAYQIIEEDGQNDE